MNKTNYLEKPYFEHKSYWTQLGCLLLIFAGGLFILSAFGQLLGQWIWGDFGQLTDNAKADFIRFSQTFSSIGSFLLPALFFSYLATRHPFRYSNSTQLPSSFSVGMVIFLSLLLLPIVMLLASWNEMITLPDALAGVEKWMRSLSQKSEELLQLLTADLSQTTLFLNLIVLGLLPAVCEEFFFRGTLQPFFRKWTGNPHIAIIITAFIFSFMHFEFFGFIPRFLLGLYLGYLLLWSGSVWVPVIAHLCHNVFSVLLHHLALRQGIDTEQLQAADLYAYIPLFLVSLIGFIFGINWLRNREAMRQAKK